MDCNLNSHSYQGDLKAQATDDRVLMNCLHFLESSAAFCSVLSFYNFACLLGKKGN